MTSAVETAEHKLVALKALASAEQALMDAERARLNAIEGAVRAGVTWADIGEVLGISRQAAHERFAKRVYRRMAQPNGSAS